MRESERAAGWQAKQRGVRTMGLTDMHEGESSEWIVKPPSREPLIICSQESEIKNEHVGERQ